MNSKKNYSEYICGDCDKEFVIQNGVLQKRRFRCGEPVCHICYKKARKIGRHLDFYPQELIHLACEDVWSYEEIMPFLDKLGSSKKKVRFICQECSRPDIMTIGAMHHRKICGAKPICRKCSLKFATSSQEWLDKNSKAQLIAQNRPEVLKKNRDAQLRLMKNDPMFAEKRCSKSFISGTIRGIRFDSSWELYFMAYCWESKKIKSVNRFTGSLIYFDKNGVKRKYFPDFIVEYSNGKKKIIEIKGSKLYNNFQEKFNAAMGERPPCRRS